MFARWGMLMMLCASCMGAEVYRETFKDAKAGAALPPGWSRYGAVNETNFTRMEQGGLRIVDLSQKETGCFRDFPVKPGKYYRGALLVTNFGKTAPKDVIRLQLNFPVKNGKPVIFGGPAKIGGTTCFCGQAPENAEKLRIYIYTSFDARLDVLWKSFTLEESDEPLDTSMGDVHNGFYPRITKLKDMCRTTPLDRVSIQCSPRYQAEAERLAAALEKKTGKRPAIVSDTAKVSGHRILLGNRDTNDVIEMLYRRYFAYTDIDYPGRGGYEFRTVHNPFGSKENYIILGGSDDAGVKTAVDRLIARPEKDLPPVIDVRTALPLPKDIPSTEYATRMGGRFPGYGWNTLSWLLECYYRTGDAKFAREFIRLGLHPTVADMPTLKKVNEESFWDFLHPLSTPYHYTGHYIVLLWDLVEEQDVFTDAERLAVTQALSKQIIHPDMHHFFHEDIDSWPPAGIVKDRHWQWSVMMMFVLSRYMNRDYPHTVWQTGLKCADYFHDPIFRKGTWGEPSSTFSWFASSMLNETSQYLLMTGKDKPHPEGMLMTAAKVFEIMWDPGKASDANGTMSAHNHRLLAALTGDGKYHYYAEDLEFPSEAMKFGQSYRSVRDKARVPSENIGSWLIAPMPDAGCRRFNMKEPFDGLTLNTGYRDSLDLAGDRVLFDLFNELGRAPYQLNSLVLLRINGTTYLDGYCNYLQVVKNGAAAGHVPIAARLRGTGAEGKFAFHTSAVPDMAHGEWERTLLLKKRQAALIADRITAETPGPLQVLLNWETGNARAVTVSGNRILIQSSNSISAAEMRLAADGPVVMSSASRIAKLKKAGDAFHAVFRQKNMFTGELKVRVVCTADSAAAADFALDGKTVLRNVPMDSSSGDVAKMLSFGQVKLEPGEHTITMTVAAPGAAGKSDLCLWRLYFASAGSDAAIAGAGMETGKDFHKGMTPALKPGESCTFFTVCGLDAKAEKVAGNPNAALLRIPEKTLAFSGEFQPFGKGRVVWVDAKETAVLDDRYKLTVKPTSAEARAALEKLSGVPFKPVTAEALPLIETKFMTQTGLSGAVACAVTWRGEPAIFAGSRNQAAVLSANGKTLLKLTVPGRIMSLHGTGKLLLVGTVEDKIFAFDEAGKLLWTHHSDCATPFGERKHYYWFRGPYPGVFSLADMNGDIYAGSACTTERITADGKLVKRYEQLWGVPSKLLALKRSDGAYRMLCSRQKYGHDATLFVVDPVKNTSSGAYVTTMPGFRGFPGFGAMLRRQSVLADVNGDGKTELVTTSGGMYSWIQIFDETGSITHQVNFGGKPITTDMAAARGIIVTVDPMRRMIVMDENLNIKVLKDLPSEPLQVLTGKNIAVLDADGVTLYDRTGTAVKRLPVTDAQQMLKLADGTLVICSQRGNMFFFKEW